MPDACIDREELTAWLRLLLTPGLGPARQRRLLAAFGLPQQVFAAPTSALGSLASPAQVRALRQPPPGLDALVTRTLTWLEAGRTPQGQERRLLTLADADYPPALLQTEDPPLLLHAWGRPLATGPLVWPTQALAVVGSRNATPSGLGHAQAFARHLADAGWVVVSGLALGIDGAAHAGALASGLPLATLAVLGTGLDRLYPRQHAALALRIAEHGLLLSEFSLGTPPLAENFPRRNRLIAALSRGTLVVEAAPQSGSLITARLAAELGREVFAIPGSIHAPQSRGCHALIRQGAQLVETAQDILEAFALSGGTPAAPSDAGAPACPPAPGATPAPQGPDSGPDPAPADSAAPDPDAELLAALDWAPAGLDALLARTGLPAAGLQARLLALELEGRVCRLPGGLFQRIQQT